MSCQCASRHRKLLWVVWVIAFSTSTFLRAQTANGIISGTVTDETGAVLPGVSVTVRHVETGVTQTLITNDVGRYSAPQLSLGNYEVSADLAGFKTVVRSGITLTVGREAVVNIALSVGDISEKVVVSGEAPLVETTSSAIGGLVDDKKIRDLPLNGRNFAQLALLQTGVAFYNSEVKGPLAGTGLKFSVNGGRPNYNNFMLDGVNMSETGNTTPGGATGQSLGVEAIREFSVLTNTYSAAFGRNSGGIINIVSQSGTNDWHGSLFEFHRNSALDAKNFFDSPAKSIPHFVRNQFGFAVGGPIQKDKTFIFGNYEGLRERLGLTGVNFVPNALARRGLVPDSVTKQLVDVGLNANVVPYLNLYPLPNGRDLGDGTGELLTSPIQPTDEDYVMVRVDHQLSAQDSLFVRYNFDDGSVLTPSFLLSFGDSFVSRSQILTFQEKRIFSPTVVNTATFGFNRAFLNLRTVPLTSAANDPSLSFDFPGTPLGAITIGGGQFGVGNAPIPTLGTTQPILSGYNTFQYGDDVRWSKGNHNIQIGGLISRTQNNFAFRGTASGNGSYSFNGLIEFLQGRAISFGAQPPSVVVPGTGEVVTRSKMRGWRQTNLGFYIQDDIKLRSNFTLNLGLRNESMATLHEVNNKESNLRTRLDSAWTIGDPIFNNPGLAWQPRIGFAWDPFGDGKTAVRAGFGVFNDVFNGSSYTELGGNNFPWSAGLTVVNPPPSTFPNGFALIRTATSLLSVVHMNPDVQFPTKLHFNLNLQRELLANMTLTVAYVGSQSSHLSRRTDQNTAVPQIRSDGSKFFPAGQGRENTRFDQIATTVTDVTGSYHAFQLSLNRRFSHGLQFQGSYTFSKSLDDASVQLLSEGRNSPSTSSQWDNRKADRGPSNWDVRNNFIFNFTYEVPFGQGLRGVQRQLASGWTFSGILSLAGAPPFTVTTGVARSQDATRNTSERPASVSGRSNNPILGGPDKYYDSTAFALPQLGTYGDLGRNTLRGPGLKSVDFSLNKMFPIHEQRAIQFRAEFFNIVNHPNFGRPDSILFTSTLASRPSAGRILTTVGTSRQVQLGLKVIF